METWFLPEYSWQLAGQMYLHPNICRLPTKLWEGNVFSRVCHSVQGDSHVTMTHDVALEQGPFLYGNPLVRTSSNLFIMKHERGGLHLHLGVWADPPS